MSNFFKSIILNKMKHLSAHELLHYSQQYGFNIDPHQAKQIESYLRQNTVDPFSKKGRKIMYNDLAQITDSQTANKAQRLFENIIKENGLEYLF
ncbi:DUF2624 domain-containing protein [Virgibacillus siamensis]|uniref:DUF2624 domain-containing protein n=1 Tax=Virgibacillus siamensis TaxID=480071 RepID=UPI000984FCB1|nr:DUF2624 family protein [Virgibacillus siamensis]